MTFAEFLKKAAADKTNKLNGRQRARLRRIAGNPKKCKRLEKCCENELYREDKKLFSALKPGGDSYNGLDGDNYGFDWDGLLAFLEKLIPIIERLISLFNL
ncbi:MAG: hypothetical protein IPJ01_12160 [Micavibrio sp.]|mgnify:CR=1 FL=1|nr:hypothetical protein [Micavibrio sp.]